MEEILKQLEGVIEHVVSMKVTEDTDILLAELNDIHAKLSAQQNMHPTSEAESQIDEDWSIDNDRIGDGLSRFTRG